MPAPAWRHVAEQRHVTGPAHRQKPPRNLKRRRRIGCAEIAYPQRPINFRQIRRLNEEMQMETLDIAAHPSNILWQVGLRMHPSHWNYNGGFNG